MLAKIGRLLSYSFPDFLFLLKTSFLLAQAHFIIKVSPSSKIIRMLNTPSASRSGEIPAGAAGIRRRIELLETADRNLPGGPFCLRRVLVLKWLFEKDAAAKVHIGVRKIDNRFEAHTWMELGDQMLENQPYEKLFESLAVFPARP